MLLSMTGYGDAQQQRDGIVARVEIRSVNNRHLKLINRLPDGYASIEPRIEACVREHVRRGTVNLTLQIERSLRDDAFVLNDTLLTRYHQQLSDLGRRLHDTSEIPLAALLVLPGVVGEQRQTQIDLDHEWPIAKSVLEAALENLNAMRAREGEAMAADLLSNCAVIGQELDEIEKRTPDVVISYETRLLERIQQLLAEHDVQAEPAAVIREVGIFADRVDTSEEVVRLRSHLKQFRSIVETETSPGRKLEFLIQELLRETNTIGSKANDAPVARHVVQIKTIIERLREMIQNVE